MRDEDIEQETTTDLSEHQSLALDESCERHAERVPRHHRRGENTPAPDIRTEDDPLQHARQATQGG